MGVWSLFRQSGPTPQQAKYSCGLIKMYILRSPRTSQLNILVTSDYSL